METRKNSLQDWANDFRDWKTREMPQLSLQISQRIVQLDQVRVEPVEPGTPISNRLFRGEPQDRKIAGRGTILSQARKTVAKKRDRMLANHPFAFIHGKNRSQHPLIFSVRLAKVEVWHTCVSSAESRRTLIVRRSLCIGKSSLPANPLPDHNLIFSPTFASFCGFFQPQPLPNYLRCAQAKPSGPFPVAILPVTSSVFKSITATALSRLSAT